VNAFREGARKAAPKPPILVSTSRRPVARASGGCDRRGGHPRRRRLPARDRWTPVTRALDPGTAAVYAGAQSKSIFAGSYVSVLTATTPARYDDPEDHRPVPPVAKDPEATDSIEKFVVGEEKRGISWVSAAALIDQERVEEQHAAQASASRPSPGTTAVEKIDRDHVVDRAGSKARAIEVDLGDVDCSPRSIASRRFAPGPPPAHGVRARREIPHFVPARGDVERPARNEEREVLGEEPRGGRRFGRTERRVSLVPMDFVLA